MKWKISAKISTVFSFPIRRASSTSWSVRKKFELGCREKRVLECRLKCADFGLTDPKALTDRRLRGAENFDIDLANFFQGTANRFDCELGRVAIATKVTKHDAINFSGKQFFDHGRSRVVGKMSMPRLDPLLHRPRTVGVVLQKLFVVVRLDDQGVHRPQSFDDHFRRITEIGNKSEAARAGVKREADRIDRVMRHGKRLHGDVTDLERGAGAKNSPVPMPIQFTAVADCFRGLRVCVNRHVEFAAEHLQPANVVAMLVGQQNAVELLRSHAALLEADGDLPGAKAAIDQNFAMIGRDERAVSGTAAPEHRQTEHDRYLVAAPQFSQIKFTRRDKNSPAGKARIRFFFSE